MGSFYGQMGRRRRGELGALEEPRVHIPDSGRGQRDAQVWGRCALSSQASLRCGADVPEALRP